MNLVFDIDGVLADFNGHVRDRFGIIITGAEMALSDDDWKRINEGDFWDTLPPLPGLKLLVQWSPLPEHVYALTSRSLKRLPSLEARTRKWFERNGVEFYPGRILFANPRPEKMKILEGLRPARFIDDSILNAGMCDRVRGIDATLLLQPYNEAASRYFPDIATTRSVRDWLEGR